VWEALRAWNTRPQAYAAVWGQDFEALFKALTQPMLLMCAPDDVLAPYFERAKTLRPDATALLIQGGANFEPDLAAPEVAAAIRDFVDLTEKSA
jgi:pimeloyl-ACP methyl ester carboxylesterase